MKTPPEVSGHPGAVHTVPGGGQSATGINGFDAFQEYGGTAGSSGTQAPGSIGGIGYGWLGTKQRFTLSNSGLMLMGARVYSPALGSFSSRDAIFGGNSTSYNYPGDPVNRSDTTGLWDGCSYVPDTFSHGGRVARFTPACNWHDRCIYYNNKERGYTRFHCDSRWKIKMKRICNRVFSNMGDAIILAGRRLCRQRANLYYNAVRGRICKGLSNPLIGVMTRPLACAIWRISVEGYRNPK